MRVYITNKHSGHIMDVEDAAEIAKIKTTKLVSEMRRAGFCHTPSGYTIEPMEPERLQWPPVDWSKSNGG